MCLCFSSLPFFPQVFSGIYIQLDLIGTIAALLDVVSYGLIIMSDGQKSIRLG